MSPIRSRVPWVLRVTIADPKVYMIDLLALETKRLYRGQTLFSTLRSSFFFPISYRRNALPTPAARRPWKAIKLSGTSSVSV